MNDEIDVEQRISSGLRHLAASNPAPSGGASRIVQTTERTRERHRRPRGWLTPLLACCLVLALVAVSVVLSRAVGGHDTRGRGVAAASAPASGPAGSDDSTEVAAANAIEPVGFADDPQYNSVSVDAVAHTVTIWRVGDAPSGALDGRYRSLVPAGVTLLYAEAPLTAAQVSTLDALVEKEMKDFHAAGLNVTLWGQSQGPGKPYIVSYHGAGAPSAAIVQKFQRFGPGTVMFTPGGVVQPGS